jgi:glycerol-3-phosphate O-acyltransferase
MAAVELHSAMVEKPKAVLRGVWRLLFSHITLDPETEARIKQLPQQGRVVYVMRTRSILDYLFFNYLFLRTGLPLSGFANDVTISFVRTPAAVIRDLWRLLTGKGPSAPAFLERVLQQGKSVLLFLRLRGIASERSADPVYFERLVRIQRGMDEPMLLLPSVIMWPRQPPWRRRRLLDIVFGDVESASKIRKLGHFIRFRKLASVQFGEPVDLAAFINDHPEWSDRRVAATVRRALRVHLAREAMAIRGPAVKHPSTIRKEILTRPRFVRELGEIAQDEGMTRESALRQATRYLREIAAATNFEVLLIFGVILDFVFNRVFQGVEVDAAGMRRIKDAAKLSRTAPLILAPCHKSHLDYLVISWVFMRNEFIPPHIAAGANLSFFPLGWWFRHSGAFFLRRTFAGMPIYKLVFRSYLWKLIREGYPVELFIEGGRSRTGKVLPPRLGMLAMMLEGVREGEYRDLQIVPINLSYEQVVELESYRRELTGGEKRAESVGGMVKSSTVLRSRYGRVYVSFEEPIRLSEYLRRAGVEDLGAVSRERSREITRRLAFHIMRQIQEATTVAPSALLSAALMGHSRRGVSSTVLTDLVGFLLWLLEGRRTRMSRSIAHRLAEAAEQIRAADAKAPRDGHRARGEAVRPLVDEAQQLLRRQIHTVECDGEAIYTVPEKARIELDYHRNIVLAILAPDAIVATVLSAANDGLDAGEMATATRQLSCWFRREFIFPTEGGFDQNLTMVLDRMTADGLIEHGEDGRWRGVSPRALDFLRGLMVHLVEGYWVGAGALEVLLDGAKERRAWVDKARALAERAFLEGNILRPEAASTAVLTNALELFLHEGWVVRHDEASERRATYSLADGATADSLARRRSEIARYLLVRPEDPLELGAPSPATVR